MDSCCSRFQARGTPASFPREKETFFLDQSSRHLFHATSGFPTPLGPGRVAPHISASAFLHYSHSWSLCEKVLPYWRSFLYPPPPGQVSGRGWRLPGPRMPFPVPSPSSTPALFPHSACYC